MSAILKGLHRAVGREIELGHREVKMLRPICEVCAPVTQRAAAKWWEDCPHHPYIGARGETVVEKTYDDGPDGSRIVTGTTETVIERPWPNFVGVALTMRINSGQGVEKARRKGYILPSELRDEAYPEGISDCCQFSACFIQEGLKDYGNGTYCQPREAARVYEDDTGRTIEVHNMDKRRDQIADALAKVGAAR